MCMGKRKHRRKFSAAASSNPTIREATTKRHEAFKSTSAGRYDHRNAESEVGPRWVQIEGSGICVSEPVELYNIPVGWDVDNVFKPIDPDVMTGCPTVEIRVSYSLQISLSYVCG
jgi:hypothetical protein